VISRPILRRSSGRARPGRRSRRNSVTANSGLRRGALALAAGRSRPRRARGRADRRPGPPGALAARLLSCARATSQIPTVFEVFRGPRRALVLGPAGHRDPAGARSSSTCRPRSTSRRRQLGLAGGIAAGDPGARGAAARHACPGCSRSRAGCPSSRSARRRGRPGSGPGPPSRCPETRWSRRARLTYLSDISTGVLPADDGSARPSSPAWTTPCGSTPPST